MIYQAMFDEMDEGTAIFKCTDDPPVGESRFLTLEGLPSDHYLWLTGMGRKLLRGEIEATDEAPQRKANDCKRPAIKKLGALDCRAGTACGTVIGELFRFRAQPESKVDKPRGPFLGFALPAAFVTDYPGLHFR